MENCLTFTTTDRSSSVKLQKLFSSDFGEKNVNIIQFFIGINTYDFQVSTSARKSFAIQNVKKKSSAVAARLPVLLEFVSNSSGLNHESNFRFRLITLLSCGLPLTPKFTIGYFGK